jgi:hypothetical protein
MTAFLVFTEFEPLIVATAEEAASDGHLVEWLSQKGIDKFIAHEIDVDRLREAYGVPFEVIEADIVSGRNLRVLDSKGSHAFANVRFADLGKSIWYES